ncbi:MAG TPA: hypothetical protein VFS19_02015 [Planctomycetota bacterium]|nr:hypothetical protein [Planctomycetota bacterium]
MPKYMAVHVVVLAGLVVAVTLLVFTARALTFRIDKLESAAEKREVKPVTTVEPDAKPTLPPTDELKPVYIEGNKYGIREVPPPSTPVVPEKSETLTPAQEEAVAKSVDRILKEKYAHLPKNPNPEDLEKTLEKELGLSESQKVRIGEILKWKRGEQRKLFEGEDPTLGSTMKKAMDIDKKAEAAIKNELDATQQAKYDQLKKDGKIPQGVSVQIEARDGPESQK